MEILSCFRHNKNELTQKFLDSNLLAKKMFEISKASGAAYCQSLIQYENFCKKLFLKQDVNCFCATFLCVEKENENLNILGFLNVQMIFCDAEIDFICVDSKQHRRGIAGMLLKEFESILKLDQNYSVNQTKIFLEVGSNNHRAISLYEKFGFQRVSVRKKYYKNLEDAVLMEKELK